MIEELLLTVQVIQVKVIKLPLSIFQCGFVLILSFFLCEFLGNYFTSVCNLWKPERKPRRAHVQEFRPDAGKLIYL